jgi:hypothetical protein
LEVGAGSENYPFGFCANVIDREVWITACIFLILADSASINAARRFLGVTFEDRFAEGG